MIGPFLALIALFLELFHWATTRDASLGFYALVLVTLAILVDLGTPFVGRWRRPAA